MKKRSFWPSYTSREPEVMSDLLNAAMTTAVDNCGSKPPVIGFVAENRRQTVQARDELHTPHFRLSPSPLYATANFGPKCLLWEGRPRWANPLPQLGYMYNYLWWLAGVRYRRRHQKDRYRPCEIITIGKKISTLGGEIRSNAREN
jgi:hypothetical protein